MNILINCWNIYKIQCFSIFLKNWTFFLISRFVRSEKLQYEKSWLKILEIFEKINTFRLRSSAREVPRRCRVRCEEPYRAAALQSLRPTRLSRHLVGQRVENNKLTFFVALNLISTSYWIVDKNLLIDYIWNILLF